MRISSLTGNSITACGQNNVLTRKSLTLKYDHMTGTGKINFILVWAIAGTSYPHCNTVWHLLIIAGCSWLSAWHSHTCTTPHSLTSQKSVTFTATKVRTLNLTITMFTDQDTVFSNVIARLNCVHAMLRLIHGWHDSHLVSCLWSTSVMAYCRTRCRVRRG
jgi:hypothetical protein